MSDKAANQVNGKGVELVVENAVTCRICGAPADRYEHLFQCQKNPCHMADLFTGIFSDCTYPGDPK